MSRVQDDLGKPLTTYELAKRMVRVMDDPHGKDLKRDSIRKALDRLLSDPPSTKWSLEYIEAFGAAIGVPAVRLLSLDYNNAKVDEATYMQYLWSALGRRITSRLTRRLVLTFQKSIDAPGMIDLLLDVADVLFSAKSRSEAVDNAGETIRRSRVWTRKPADCNEEREQGHTVRS